jgi:hypothetical protein
MIPVETIPGKGESKGEWWRDWAQVWYSWYIVKTFVNATTEQKQPQYCTH